MSCGDTGEVWGEAAQGHLSKKRQKVAEGRRKAHKPHMGRICRLQWLEEMQGISRVWRGKVREAPCGAFYLSVSGMRFSSGHEIPVFCI